MRVSIQPENAGKSSSLIPVLTIALLLSGYPALAAGTDIHSEVQLLLKSPDAKISGTYDLPADTMLVNALLRSPLMMAHLWDVYGFGPHYRVQMKGDAIHVDDPTGIQGDIYLVEQAPNRRVYYGTGALDHELVPAFRGRMALVLTTSPKGSGVTARVEVYIRAESRVLGLMARAVFPLVRSKAEHRVSTNAQDLSTILHDLSFAPKQTASKLKDKEDVAALDVLLASAGSQTSQVKSNAAPQPPRPSQTQPVIPKKK